jgi:PIN domain nuclease of toxin-antitoxin system
MEADGMTYLDTHVVVWLYAFGSTKLSDRACELIEQSTKPLISPMVMLEMQFLYEIHRIVVVPRAIFNYLSDRIALEICDRELSKVIEIAMQQTWTRDPFDRMITSQAAVSNDILITKDQSIQGHYPHAVW